MASSFGRMKSPYVRLEEFENRRGNHSELLSNAVDLSIIERKSPDEEKAHRQAESLLKFHSNLVAQCMGYSVAKEKILNMLSDKIRNADGITIQVIERVINDIKEI